MVTIFIAVLSCCVYEDFDECGIYLKFIFDYNMEFADSFDPQVGTVDVYIFDENDKYLFHKHADCARDLIDRKLMHLFVEKPSTIYKVITVGGLSEHFRFTDLDDNDFVPGITTIQAVKLALYRRINEVSHEFTHLWFGETTEIQYQSELSTWPVYLIRNTNNFHVVLHNTDTGPVQQSGGTPPYTFEIVTPEGAVYGYNNAPLLRETVIYRPFYWGPGEETEDLSVGKLNTMRLFADDPDGYQLLIRDTQTSDIVWEYDLMELLKNTKLSHPDGTGISFQEYLDRQSEWNIIILYRKKDSNAGFVAMKIIINGWIIWENDIEV